MIGVVFSTGMGPGQLEVSPDLNHSVNSRNVAYLLLVHALLYGAVVAMETAQLVLNTYQAF